MFYVDSGSGGRPRPLLAPAGRHAARGRRRRRGAARLDGGGTDWQPHTDPLVLVCTNGRHDACCATFGRPLARDLRQSAARDDVWECSHIGGDRFAGNLVILPEGLYFGRCDGASAQRVIEDYRRGAIHLDNYRGRSVLGFYEQAAEFFVRRELGLTAIGAVTAVRRVGERPRHVRRRHHDGRRARDRRGATSPGPRRRRSLRSLHRSARPACAELRARLHRRHAHERR